MPELLLSVYLFFKIILQLTQLKMVELLRSLLFNANIKELDLWEYKNFKDSIILNLEKKYICVEKCMLSNNLIIYY